MSGPSASTVRHALARRRLWLAAAAAAILAVAVSQAFTHGARAAPAAVVTVKLHNIGIHPAKITIKAGTTVKWLWLDADIDTQHNVTSKTGGLRFKSSATMESGAYSVRFETPGRYFYECTIHPQAMQGEITVTK